MREAANHLSQIEGRDYVSSAYVASTVPGQKYSGHLYGQSGWGFIMCANDSKLIAGHAADIPEHAKGAQAIQFTATDGHASSIKANLPGGKGHGLSNF